ncbi:hypothetical protein [Rhodoblastus acidophilus]|uniref:hypothetical protein n=1 Tax=Rhodoblastus acidophilus TaxID=1074 RepID=UPI000B5122D2|nr:hypothetical protein [Rhodoblastus acidophilus]PPQ40092.1 hypothetical protein CKO16_04680 [Rhodoblastus acidophilus]RAI21106.1 hypothetical protein CH337_08265 [Rhodoblastus acidophilus]
MAPPEASAAEPAVHSALWTRRAELAPAACEASAFDYLFKASLRVEALDEAALRLLRGPAFAT